MLLLKSIKIYLLADELEVKLWDTNNVSYKNWDYISSQLKMEREVALLKIQDDGDKVIKFQVESLRTFSWGVHFSQKFRTKLFLTINLLEIFAREILALAKPFSHFNWFNFTSLYGECITLIWILCDSFINKKLLIKSSLEWKSN